MKIKKEEVALLTFLCVLLLLGGITTVFFPAPQFSPRENRYLSTMPTLTRKALLSGEYAKAVDSYVAEHIRTRDAMRQVRTASELTLGKCVVNGVLICPDGRLIQLSEENKRTKKQNANAVEKIKSLAAESGLPCSVCILPAQASLSRLLPSAYPVRQSDADSALLSLLDNPDYWYRTDHHMTMTGAFALYNYLSHALDYTPYGMDAFTPIAVSAHFFGTSDAKAGVPFTKPDTITLYRYEGDLDYTVSKESLSLNLEGFYDTQKLSTRDGYGVFLGGNHSLLEINKGGYDERPVLLVIKDSYANALLPLLAQHYRLIVADPRYGCPAVSTLLTGADRVLVLCGEGTLSSGFLEGNKI